MAGDPAQLGALLDRRDLGAHRVDGAAAEPALGGGDGLHVGQSAGAVRGGPAGQLGDGEVRGDGVEAAGVHDAGAGLPGGRVGGVDRVPDEEHLAGQVGVVRAGPGAGLDQRQAVAGVGADGGDDGTGAGRELGQRRGVGRVGGEHRPAAARPRQVGADQLDPGPGAPGQRDPGALGCVLGQVAGDQLPDEPAGPEQDEIVRALAHGPILADG
nr:hypothetical protein [Klenkia terrae]